MYCIEFERVSGDGSEKILLCVNWRRRSCLGPPSAGDNLELLDEIRAGVAHGQHWQGTARCATTTTCEASSKFENKLFTRVTYHRRASIEQQQLLESLGHSDTASPQSDSFLNGPGKELYSAAGCAHTGGQLLRDICGLTGPPLDVTTEAALVTMPGSISNAVSIIQSTPLTSSRSRATRDSVSFSSGRYEAFVISRLLGADGK